MADSTSNINMILRTKQEGDAPEQALKDLQAMKGGLTNLEKAVAGTRTTIGGLDGEVTGFGKNLGSMADLMDGLGMSIPIDPMMALGQAIALGGQLAAESISEYAEYGETISKLAAFTSTSTEEMSRMYQMADDLRIGTSDLEMALKTMTTKGTAPSVEGLAQLSDQYLSIQDPLARAQFLVDNFGRAGQEMARLMELGGEAIQGNADEIADWMIVTAKSEQQVKDYMLAMDAWDEKIMEVRYSLAMGLIPALTKFLELLTNPSSQAAANFLNTILGRQVELAEETGKAFQAAAQGANAYGQAVESASYRGNLMDRPNYGNINNANPYGGGKAEGGAVMPGMTYKMGEREVEYIRMGAPGMVTPASQGGGEVRVNIDYRPVISTMSRIEAETVLIPLIQSALRRA